MNSEKKERSASGLVANDHNKILTSAELLNDFIDELEAKLDHKKDISKSRCISLFRDPVSALNKDNQLVAIGGLLSSRQKNIAEGIIFKALESKLVCAYIGKTQGVTNTLRRYLSRNSGVPIGSLITASLSEKQWKKLTASVKTVKTVNNLLAVCSESLTIKSVVESVKALKTKNHKLTCILISINDFIQPFTAYDDIYRDTSLGTSLNVLCKELGITIIVSCYLSDAGEHRQDIKAFFSDFPVGLHLADEADISIICERYCSNESLSYQNENRLLLTCLHNQALSTFCLEISKNGGIELGEANPVTCLNEQFEYENLP